MSARFVVAEVRGMCLGAGGFVVRDTQLGDDSLPFTWRADAERIAGRFNAQHEREQQEAADLRSDLAYSRAKEDGSLRRDELRRAVALEDRMAYATRPWERGA